MTTSTEKRGIGVDGTLGAEAVAELAEIAEGAGYSNFWINVTSQEPDPVEILKRIAARTKSIEIAVGLFPLDRFPAEELSKSLQKAGIAGPRFILCVAAGQVKQGVLDLVGKGVATLRAAVPGARIGIGGYGPKVLQLTGRVADVLNANWMTPERLAWATEEMMTGAREAHRTPPAIYLYHRAAQGPDAEAIIEAEMTHYRRLPVHDRHQAAMGYPKWVGVAAVTREDVAQQLEPYRGKCIPVMKTRPKDPKDMAEWRRLVRFFAPNP